MSFFSPRPGYNTSVEASLLTALNNLAAGGAGTAIQKTTATTFSNVSVTGGTGMAIGGTVTSGTTGSLLFVASGPVLAQDNNNAYVFDSSTGMATNTNFGISFNTGGDFTGTDAVNIYAQYDAYLPNSAITNSITGLATDGATPGVSASSSRGTGASPTQLQTGDMAGGFSMWAAQGATSPTYTPIAGAWAVTTGSSTNNLGGEYRIYTKADGGLLVQNFTVTNVGQWVQPNTATGIALYNTTDQTTNYERVVAQYQSNVFTLGTYVGGTGTARSLQLGVQGNAGTNTLATGRTLTINQNQSVATGTFDFTNNSTGLAGSSITLNTGFSGASVTQSMLSIQGTVNQTGISSYNALLIQPYEQAIGSGTHYLINAGTNSAASAGGTYTSKFSVDNGGNISSAGNMTIATGKTYQINGTQIAASNLSNGTTGSGNIVLATSPTMTNPTVGTQSSTDNSTLAASTAYVTTAISNAIAAVNPAVAVVVATVSSADTSSLTYNNGASGVGATFTGTTNTALTFDGVTLTSLGQRVLVKNDTQSPSGAFNGIYYLTQLQTGILPPILTRALDYDQPSDMNNTGAIPVQSGTTQANTSWLLTSQVVTVGTTPLTFAQFSVSPTNIVTLTGAQTVTGKTFTGTVNDIYANNAITAVSNAATVPITSRLSTVTNNSAATLTITITTASATDGQLLMVRVLDFSAVAQTLTWVNTENGNITVPSVSNGSTTSFLTVCFIYNGGTSKWRCQSVS